MIYTNFIDQISFNKTCKSINDVQTLRGQNINNRSSDNIDIYAKLSTL